jgi:sec-independent protein translocase protein TatA
MVGSMLLFLNIGTPEMMLILFVALLLFGGKKLPELARGLGKGIREFKDASEDVKREIHNQINSFEEKLKEEDPYTPEPIAEQPQLNAAETVDESISESSSDTDSGNPLSMYKNENALIPQHSIAISADGNISEDDLVIKNKEENINH